MKCAVFIDNLNGQYLKVIDYFQCDIFLSQEITRMQYHCLYIRVYGRNIRVSKNNFL